MLGHIVVYWVLSALVLLALTYILPGFYVRGVGTALVAVIVIGLLNATLGLLLRIVAFPLTLLTFGLFLWVINAVVLKAAAAIMPGFSIKGFLPALIGAAVLTLLHFLVRLGPHSRWF